MRFDPDRHAYTLEGEYRYDVELGELHELVDEKLKQVVKIRQRLEDEIVIQAVIFELEKRGYTVISPEVSQDLHGS